MMGDFPLMTVNFVWYKSLNLFKGIIFRINFYHPSWIHCFAFHMTSIWSNLRSRKTFAWKSSDSWWSPWTLNSLDIYKDQKGFISGFLLTYLYIAPMFKKSISDDMMLTFSPCIPTPIGPVGPGKPGGPKSPWKWNKVVLITLPMLQVSLMLSYCNFCHLI